VICVDAMEWSLVRRWATAGRLPALSQFMERGVRAELGGPAAQLPDTAWPCLFTGMNPATFGRFFYVQYDPRTMGIQHLDEEAIGLSPVWERLSLAGQRVGVVDPPHFAATRSLNGVLLAHWGAHAMHSRKRSIPETLLSEIEARFGRHPVGECDAVDDTPASLVRLRRRILDGVRLHGEVIRALIQDSPWDTFIAGFSESHCAGHHFWRFMDPSHPRHPRTDLQGLADTIECVYRAIDQEIEKILNVVGPEVRCMVVSPHGMGPLYHASWSLQEMLDALGFGERSANRTALGPGRRKARANPWRAAKMVVPGALQYTIRAALPRRMQQRLVEKIYMSGHRWEACRAFAIPNNDTVGAIRINLEGRDKPGLVPAAQYDLFCKEITEALHELEDPATDRPIVKRVTFIPGEFHGPFLDRLPDLTVLWEQSFPWTSVRSPRFGTLELAQQDARSGSHTEHGFLLAAGPGIPAGRELEGASVYDITPTILETAAVELPSDLDGRPLPIATVM
jgi:predicted AlkP superfamily phosphohydrolase/phosphomutase